MVAQGIVDLIAVHGPGTIRHSKVKIMMDSILCGVGWQVAERALIGRSGARY
jgi:hypothetical protein